ncbi:TIGR03564 family F420-dependent LLM class oxidoreductase [Frankia sp. AgB1.9]|uniref:TIGR03564 family F420-dependent LLM class oxidoreductase n=1 Tax=unclassified Frankia TaxID=2632575 RepID=UPI001933A21B|nr:MULTISPECIES: TIGR03564 family F420-dependent LLM class oxidoreductase [unclassified Frankia]MBL7488469.1 TIGR03564 family F420-dependent LLM class oxidoreductase [Frankia sp. AgW1.1]MBL7551136.1 TIGR03564 family F420-dependent LLM class oxidoreductase [Frankia sp. AgB1.9]MBL7620844.1 TIGR03564 family F420-dependent LLM class oxidoreductase [Frankia sp. AgB1.8]
MKIGLTGRPSTTAKLVEQAKAAEKDGFSTVWYDSTALGDPLAAMAVAGRETSTIELGTAVLQTYPCHPVLQANRVAAAAEAMGRAGLTLGIGPSHRPLVTGLYGLSYDSPGRNTEEYLHILVALLAGETVTFEGSEWTARGASVPVARPVPILLAALGPRLLRVAGELADGAVLFMAPAKAIETHVAPRLRTAASGAGRPEPRIVAGLPVAVHDDLAEARAAAAATSQVYGSLPNYRRIMEIGGAETPADAAILGDEQSVTRQLQNLLDAGATDIQAFVVPVGLDRRASRQRTLDLLASLTG